MNTTCPYIHATSVPSDAAPNTVDSGGIIAKPVNTVFNAPHKRLLLLGGHCMSTSKCANWIEVSPCFSSALGGTLLSKDIVKLEGISTPLT